MSAVSRAVVSPNQMILNQADNLRIRIFAEIDAITRQLNGSGLNDEMTRMIRNWKDRLRTALRSNGNAQRVVNTQRVLDQHILVLQQMLTDPISHGPLDLNSVLGSDGRSYGEMSLRVHLHIVGQAYRNRSPLEPNNPAPFTTVPHTNVQYMLGWLRGYNALLPNDVMEARFKQIENNAPAIPVTPPPANSPLGRIQRLVAEQAARDKEDAERGNNIEAQMKSPVNQFVQNAVVIIQNAALDMQQQAARIQGLEHNLNAGIQRLNGIAQELENDLARLEADNQALNIRIADVQANIGNVKREDLDLELLINETEKEIKKNKHAWVKDALIAAAVVGICVFAIYAAPLILPGAGGVTAGASSSASIYVAPTASVKGIGLNIGLIF